jgi:hypothetical protein
MNMNANNYQEQDFNYQAYEAPRGGKEKIQRKSRMKYSSTSRAPVMHNGIHRRRNKRFAW